jgi:hypothetical protein
MFTIIEGNQYGIGFFRNFGSKENAYGTIQSLLGFPFYSLCIDVDNRGGNVDADLAGSGSRFADWLW